VVSYVNPAVERFLGQPPEKAIGMNVEEYITEDSIRRIQGWLKNAAKSVPPQEFFQGEIEYIHKNGHRVPSEINVTIVRDAFGAITMLEGISRDITKRKRTEDEKQRLEKQLYQAQKMESIGTLAGGIAHDFNNSLQIVLCSINLINEQLNAAHVAHENVQLIKKSAEQMAKWTNDLLAYARGTFSLKRNLNINESIENAVDLVRYNLTGRIEMDADLDPNLPAIMATPGEMEQIMVNLLINASEAIEGRGKIRIETKIARRVPGEARKSKASDTPMIHVSVTDSGIGMSPETIERIYEPFFSTKFIGRGMGMAVVFGIVKSHNGRIFLKSEPGMGTRFDLYFPIVAKEENQGKSQEPTSEEIPPIGDKILLVDDEEELVDLISRAFSDRGMEVVSAYNGAQAIDVLGRHPDVGLVILDMVMPELDGLQAYVNIKQRIPNAKFLVISGYDAYGPAKEVMEAGADDFLQKPFDIFILLDRVNKLQQK
jgi:PAS domain S-box-containing protein